MDNTVWGRGMWIVSSMCLVASYLWRKLWSLLSYWRKGQPRAPADIQLKDQKGREGKEKPGLSLKLQKKPPDLSDTSSLKKHPLQQKDIQKLNQQNAERSSCMQTTGSQDLETEGEVPQVTLESQGGLDRLNAILDNPKAPAAKQREDSKVEGSRVKVEVLSKFETKKEESPKMGKGKEAKEKVKEAAVTPADSVRPSICKTPQTQKPLPADASVKPTDKPRNVDPMLQRKDESKSVATRKDECKSVATRKDESKSVATRKDESKSVATRKDESKSVATRKDESKSVPTRKDQSKSTPSSLVEAKPDHSSKVASSSQTQVPEKVPEPQECNESRYPEEVKKEGVDEGGKEAMEEGEMGRQTAGGETAVAEPQEGAEDAGDSEQRAANLEEFKRLWLQKKEELEGLQGRQEEAETKFMIDVSHPPIAPFSHRIVATKPNQINNFYTINKEEMLGGGRFGQVHKCVENSSGLTLAAKIIKARSPKEKDTVKNEIQVMNQLDHATLIQLYAAYESIYDVILVLEYVDGGELFDRIIDENYKLTELDTVHFIRQICEGVQHMHKMSIVHLDLKPENIMCVSRVTNKIKIIDFGLARMYKPREKLKVSFGTPEFLAPEVVNYEFVSFRTDMWSLGVIMYMLLSSLSPFLGDDDNETLNNILSCQWTFEEDEFTEISEEAKDFISKLLVLNKSWRMNSSEALEHDWLSNPGLHYRLHRKKNKCRSRRASCIPLSD
ncbi:myosin light chain kinase 2, skeletal/cardiac muscle-like isoform X2 [Conger conger]|uniref:myosin light chain kinase 2, skeletal/cardiac muscle-like isoform X2 n=1 Tax=Conger conger TaxID=82655 RepID=UPI002A5AB296|nr:myosin light chain kinase 2, skeletal/cardiac muscle-like isoform X2 [Conger conger]